MMRALVLVGAATVACGRVESPASKTTASTTSTGSPTGPTSLPPTIVASPDVASETVLPNGVQVVDLAMLDSAPVAAVLARDASGKASVVQWTAGSSKPSTVSGLPDGFEARAIAAHPSRAELFVAGRTGTTSQILVLTYNGTGWITRRIFETPREITRMLVGPRPFGADSVRYRLFFATKLANGGSSLRSVTDAGTIEYQVAGPKSESVRVANVDEQPNSLDVPAATPMSVHPRGEPLLWQDAKGCAHRLPYEDKNWGSDSVLAAIPCGGTVLVMPNGRSMLRWQPGTPGVAVLSAGTAGGTQAGDKTFLIEPTIVPDGKGVIGVVADGNASKLVYAPIHTPLADVANAWQLAPATCSDDVLTRESGYFVQHPGSEQLYSVYESFAYGDPYIPPFLVTTDVFWENFAAAYNGVFIILEKRRAIPAFWTFVDSTRAALARTATGTMWAKAFDALVGFRQGVTTGEANNIATATRETFSPVLDTIFNFEELKPRGHYTSSPEMKQYYRAMHYLTELGRIGNPSPLSALPASVRQRALDWISVYGAFIAPSRASLVWSNSTTIPSPFAKHPWDHPTVFPLSWGLDNETLESAVYHEKWPPAEQIIGPTGVRVVPSGVDVADVYGSALAHALLAPDFAKYPPLGPVLSGIAARRPHVSDTTNVYDRWLDALAVEWADSSRIPGTPASSALWSVKRLQTGLASWATLREATILVNERAEAAEAGEGGFEELVPDKPRGYVEPAPKTLEAIASLYDALANKVRGMNEIGPPTDRADDWSKEPLREGILHRLAESAAEVRQFEAMAQKELNGVALSDSEYDAIRAIGGSVEHKFLVYKSLATDDLGIPKPDPMPKIADVQGDLVKGLLEVAVGGPLEWRQIVPYFGRRELAMGSVYSYYEFSSKHPYDNEQWRREVDKQPHPAWVQPLIASTAACRSAAVSR